MRLVDARPKRALDVGLLDRRKWSALHFAASLGMKDMVARLLKASVDVDIETAEGQTPFQLAAKFVGTALETLELLRPYSEIHKKTNKSQTALHLAAEIGNLATVEYLLKHFADDEVNSKDDFGDTALLCAARTGHKAVVRLLLPYSTSSATPDDDEMKAAAGITATVVDFNSNNVAITSRRIFDLIYDRSFSSPTISLEAELRRVTGKGGLGLLSLIHI